MWIFSNTERETIFDLKSYHSYSSSPTRRMQRVGLGLTGPRLLQLNEYDCNDGTLEMYCPPNDETDANMLLILIPFSSL